MATIREKQSPKLVKGVGSRHVYEILRNEILSLALKPGEPLDETSLAERFSLSRSPVREAMVRLAAEGLLVTLSNRSTLVAPINFSDFPRYVEALDYLQRINTRLAAKYRTVGEIEVIRKKAGAFDAACQCNDYLQMSATNRDFHMAIAAAGKNVYLARAYGQLLDEGRRMLHMHFDYITGSPDESLLNSDHEEMVLAIENQDISLADRLAHAHTRQFHDRFMRFMSAKYDDDFAFNV